MTVKIAGQVYGTTADPSGNWRVTLDPLSIGEPLEMDVSGEKNRLTVSDVLVGEVWVCSGQSNMEWRLLDSNDADLEVVAADFPQIRLITVASTGSPTPAEDFDGHWDVCSPQTVGDFTAVGFFFGRELWNQLHVPIGLIDISWGGSSCETWIKREQLEGQPWYAGQLAYWDKMCADFDEPKLQADYERRLAQWKIESARACQEGQPDPPPPAGYDNPIAGQSRPANLYNSRVYPLISLAIRGVIFYQGEANANRGYQYREMFPQLVQNWRDDWKQGDFPFYWVQVANYLPTQPEPGESDWAELREAQSMALDRLPNTGQAVAIDLGEGNDIHPRNKVDVGRRLVRLALANDYHFDVPYRSPRFESIQKTDSGILLRFSNTADGLLVKRSAQVLGFAVAGNDRKWVWADARIVGEDQIEVRSDAVKSPVAVRYAWADNPVCNVYNSAGLPLTPFRTDDWPGVSVDAR